MIFHRTESNICPENRSSTSLAPTFESFAETGEFAWYNTSGKPCDGPFGGCSARDGTQASLDEWTGRGLPRTGWSYCRGRCHCILVPMIDFGLDLAEDLDTGAGFDSSTIPPPARAAGQPFSEAPEGYDPEDFVDELEDLPIIGLMREEVDGIIRAFREGIINFREAKALADRWLLGLLT